MCQSKNQTLKSYKLNISKTGLYRGTDLRKDRKHSALMKVPVTYILNKYKFWTTGTLFRASQPIWATGVKVGDQDPTGQENQVLGHPPDCLTVSTVEPDLISHHRKTCLNLITNLNKTFSVLSVKKVRFSGSCEYILWFYCWIYYSFVSLCYLLSFKSPVRFVH